MKKRLSIALAIALILVALAMAYMTEDERHAWALANGYVQVEKRAEIGTVTD